jgi:hypothetical protein
MRPFFIYTELKDERGWVGWVGQSFESMYLVCTSVVVSFLRSPVFEITGFEIDSRFAMPH